MDKKIKKLNKKLIKEYPFLRIRNVFSGKPIGKKGEFTYLDELPIGWVKSFIPDFLKELKEELVKNNMLEKYRLQQVKEKYGGMRWYDNGNTEAGYDIISKYEDISLKTCVVCGKEAKYMTSGWILPFCEECIVQHFKEKENLILKNDEINIKNLLEKKMIFEIDDQEVEI